MTSHTNMFKVTWQLGELRVSRLFRAPHHATQVWVVALRFDKTATLERV